MEPMLDQLLGEPITRLLMQRDGVSEGEIRLLMANAAASRAHRQEKPKAPGGPEPRTGS